MVTLDNMLDTHEYSSSDISIMLQLSFEHVLPFQLCTWYINNSVSNILRIDLWYFVVFNWFISYPVCLPVYSRFYFGYLNGCLLTSTLMTVSPVICHNRAILEIAFCIWLHTKEVIETRLKCSYSM